MDSAVVTYYTQNLANARVKQRGKVLEYYTHSSPCTLDLRALLVDLRAFRVEEPDAVPSTGNLRLRFALDNSVCKRRG